MTNIWFLIYAFVLGVFNKNYLVFGFNIEDKNYVTHYGSRGSMFGFSIALHRTTSLPQHQNWVIVGAPKFNASRYQPTLDTPGGVFRCDVLASGCYEIPFDSKGNQKNDQGEQIDTKSNQWMGATVSSAGIGGAIVACAPRYVFHTMQPKRVERIEPVGTCFTAKDFSVFTEYSPCRTNYWGYHRQGSCQAGFSAALTKNSERLFIGAPGSWYWQGRVYSINTAAQFPYKPPLYQEFGSGQLHAYDVTNPRNKVYSTGESDSSQDDSYFGYSVATGDFNGEKSEGVAVGMPRGNELHGIVALYSWKMVNIRNLTGDQIGAYFGYSICSVDVDGDKLDDLIIGAPLHTELDDKLHYDMGRVYVRLQGRAHDFNVSHIREGKESGGRFGFAVASLGDINLDGYGDFAVSAPYVKYKDNPAMGAIYIFYGSDKGPLAEPSQIIKARDITNFPRTFGFSLAGGLDLDSNMYTDLAVGAYESDTVFVFKARPVAIVEAQVNAPNVVNIENKSCLVRGRNHACTQFQWCLMYKGVNVPDGIMFEITFTLDSKNPQNPRMFFANGDNIYTNITAFRRGTSQCSSVPAYIDDNIQDKLTPFDIDMDYKLHPQRLPRSVLQPVIDKNRKTKQKTSINIHKNCKENNICYPDLKLRVIAIDEFLLELNVPLEIDVIITNHGEDAFNTNFYMTIPREINYINTRLIEEQAGRVIACSQPHMGNNFTLVCPIGNPFPQGEAIRLRVYLRSRPQAKLSPVYEFYMIANSTNPEKEGYAFDNVFKKTIVITAKADIYIGGKSYPEYDHYDMSMYLKAENAKTEDDLGPHVVHMYNIKNEGTFDVEEVELNIYWQHKTEAGSPLMYLLNAPETTQNVDCERSTFVNELSVRLNQELSHKSFLQTVAKVKGSLIKTAFQAHIPKVMISSTTTQTSGSGVISEEKVRELEAQDTIQSAGDASDVHIERSHRNQSSSHSNQSSNQYVRYSYGGNYDSNPTVSSRSLHSIQTINNSAPSMSTTPQSIEEFHRAAQGNNNFRVSSVDFGNPKDHSNLHEIHSSMHSKNTEEEDELNQYDTYSSYDEEYSDDALHEDSWNDRVQDRDYQRLKRDAPTNLKDPIKDIEDTEPCKVAKCAMLRCFIRPLKAANPRIVNQTDHEAWIAIRTRVVAETLANLSTTVPLNISTLATSKVTRLPQLKEPKEKIKMHEIIFTAIPKPEPGLSVVPLWVIILAACAGALILLLLIFLLYQFGFFKRNRPSDASERQPLNSRGGYHGDEHL